MTEHQIGIIMDFVSQFYTGEFVIHGTTDDGEMETSIVYTDGSSKSWNYIEKTSKVGQFNVFGSTEFDEVGIEFEPDGDWLEEED